MNYDTIQQFSFYEEYYIQIIIIIIIIYYYLKCSMYYNVVPFTKRIFF